MERLIAARRALPRKVRALSWVSFANDAASELAYPVVPLFLTVTLGAPVAAVGLIEGLAEGISVGLRGLSGWLLGPLRRAAAAVDCRRVRGLGRPARRGRCGPCLGLGAGGPRRRPARQGSANASPRAAAPARQRRQTGASVHAVSSSKAAVRSAAVTANGSA